MADTGPIDGTYVLQRGVGVGDRKTLRVTLATDVPIPGTDEILSVLAGILNSTQNIKIDADYLVLNTNDINERIGDTNEAAATNTTDPASLNALTKFFINLFQGTLDASGRVLTNGSQVTQPVSAVSLPLPTGAATAANQATEITALQAIQNSTALIVTGLTSGTNSTNGLLAQIEATLSGTLSVSISNWPATLATLAEQQNQTQKLTTIATQTAVQPSNPSTVATTNVEGQVVVTTANGVQPLSATSQRVQFVIIIGNSAPRTTNIGNVWIGTQSTAGSQKLILEPGQEIHWSPSPGQKVDLAGIYVQADTAGDGIQFIAQL